VSKREHKGALRGPHGRRFRNIEFLNSAWWLQRRGWSSFRLVDPA